MGSLSERRLINLPPTGRFNVDAFLKFAVGWHIFVGVAALGGIGITWFVEQELGTLWKILITVLLVATAVGSFFAARAIPKRDHWGRVVSLAINYLWLIAALVGTLHFLGFFLGIDTMAANIAGGIPFLGIVVAGFLLRRFAKRAGGNQERANQIGSVLILVGFLLFLLVGGMGEVLVSAVSELNNTRNILLLIGTVAFGAMTILTWRSDVAKAMNERERDSEMLSGYLFLSPNLIGFLLFFAGPLLFSLYISFTDSDAFGTQNFIGLANYAEIFNLDFVTLTGPDQLANEVLDVTVYAELTRFSLFGNDYLIGAQDKLFWISLGNTIKFVILAVPLSVIPALFLATVLNSKLRGMKFFRTLYFLPSIAAVVGVALIWRWLYNSSVGWINYFISLAIDGINAIAGSEAIINPQIGWLSDTNVALLAVVIIAAWQWLGFNTVLYLAGLQSIPGILYEAATVDGANIWTQFRRLTVPLLAPTTFFVLTTTTIQAMQIFDQVFVLTNPPGGPGTSTTTMVLYLYNQGFRNFRQGYAASIAWVLFLLIFGATIFQFQRQRTSGATD